jgi:hypothetical protein
VFIYILVLVCSLLIHARRRVACSRSFYFFVIGYTGRPIHELTRLLLFAGVRVSLIAFTFEYWFMGHCLVFCICGIFFGYNIVDAYWPVVSSPTALNSKQFRFSQFAEGVCMATHSHEQWHLFDFFFFFFFFFFLNWGQGRNFRGHHSGIRTTHWQEQAD